MEDELFFYIEGLDESILSLNKYSEETEFEFVKYTLEEFKIKFENAFTFDEDHGRSDSNYWRVRDLKFFNENEIYFKNKYVILVKYCSFFTQDDFTKSFSRLEELLKKMKLFREGYLKLISIFLFFDESSLFRQSYALPSLRLNYEPYSLENVTDSELGVFKNNFIVPEYLQFAFNSFIEYYNVEDAKLKFITLIIVLESLYNKSKDEPIKHIISRHTALTITTDKYEFAEIVKKVKLFYDLRSFIVHGKEEKNKNEDKKIKKQIENIKENTKELENIVRQVLKQLIWNDRIFNYNKPKTKEELFDILNESSPFVGLSSN